MLIDSSELPNPEVIKADICIVGGGAASMALCYSLKNSRYSIVVLDSGSQKEDVQLRKALSGRNAGKHPFCLSGQRRALGGGMRDWSGNCSLLDEEDFFKPNGDAPNWPLTFSDLDKYSEDVERFLELDTRFQLGSLSKTSNSDQPTFGETSQLRKKTFIRSQVKLPADHLQKILDSELDLRIITHATVNKLTLDKSNTVVEKVIVASKKRKLEVQAKNVVLASGLENAPILLRTLGNPEDNRQHRLPALGRFLHSHLLSLRGFLIPQKNSQIFRGWALPGDLGEKGKASIKEFHGLQVSAQQRHSSNMLNGVMFLSPVSNDSCITPAAVNKTAKVIQKKYGESHKVNELFAIRHYIEQKPLWESRVILKKRVLFMANRPVYNWKIGSAEEHTIEKNLQVLRNEVHEKVMGKVTYDSCGEELDPSVLTMNAHPMGGTVMGDNPEKSVVDKNCCVHGIRNLYILGGSVLPRGGAAMTTGVILQLAFRLAQYLTYHAGR